MLVALFILLLMLVFLQILLNANVYQLSNYLKSVLDTKVVQPSTRPTSGRTSGTSSRRTAKKVEEDNKENGTE